MYTLDVNGGPCVPTIVVKQFEGSKSKKLHLLLTIGKEDLKNQRLLICVILPGFTLLLHCPIYTDLFLLSSGM